jgi:transposase
MRALEPDVFDAVWAAVEPLLPAPTKTHPLGCHRRRIVAPFASASKCRGPRSARDPPSRQRQVTRGPSGVRHY